MRETIVAVALLAAGLALAGCETVKGVGRDITNASGSVQDAFSNRK
ncbi:MAG TPA: hypothetical protein VL404_05870 [Candidatus Eisenbacteria bacterium]|nr:hypothetical protein [Candidatus Eisenbacteria bacterium]